MFELALRDLRWRAPAHGRWVSGEDLDGLRLRDDHQRELLAAYLDSLERGEAPDDRAPWARLGWLEDVRMWLEPEVARLGHSLVGIEQGKQWSISSVLRIETDGPDLYFKVSARLPLCVEEAPVTAMLAERFPGYVPAPLAVEPRAGLDPAAGVRRPHRLAAAARRPRGAVSPVCRPAAAFGRASRPSCSPTAVSTGGSTCSKRRSIRSSTTPARSHRLDSRRRSRSSGGSRRTLKDTCRRLAGFGLPDTLVHGDLHPGNVARIDGELAYFDWTDACIAHPFFDLQSLQWQKDEATRAALLDAYLGAWEGVESPERLREAAALAAIVTPLHHAVSYQTDRRQSRAGRQAGAGRDAPVPARDPRPDARLVERLDLLDDVRLSSNTESMRPPLPLLVLLLALTLGVSAAQGGQDAVNKPLLGIAGQPDRFERQTGQDSQVRQLFLGWGQGSSWGSPFAELFAGLKPIPMIHIGTDRGRARIEVMTPAGIAAGRGDAYLVALNQAIAAYGGQVFVRVMAEMNNPRNLYAPTRLERQLEGAVALAGGVQAGVPARVPDPPRR